MTFPCPVCGEELLTPRFTDDGVMICPLCGEEIEAPEGWGRGDVGAALEGGDIATQLERLAALHDRGALTDEEFRRLKVRLIPG